MGVQMVKETEGDNFKLSGIINDGDSTLMANTKEKVTNNTPARKNIYFCYFAKV